jgi:hypothetical protein
MVRQGVSQRKPPQEVGRLLSKNNASVGASSITRADGLSPVEYTEAAILFVNDLHQLPIAAISKDASLMEQFFANDSLGG